MAPIYSIMAPRRTPLSNVLPSNTHHVNLLSTFLRNSDHRYTPYARRLITHFVLAKAAGLNFPTPPPPLPVSSAPLTASTPKSVTWTPARRSALDQLLFSLPFRVGRYELQKPWSTEVDWFEAVHLDSGDQVLCKVVRAGDPRGAEVVLAETRLAGSDCVNSVGEVLHENLPAKRDAAGVAAITTTSAEVYSEIIACDFLIYPYVDYRQCLHTMVQSKKSLPEEQSRQLFREICDIVLTGHRAGVALRDLKMRHLVWNRAGNLMLSTLDNCTVLAVTEDDESICENHASPSYAAPEMCSRTSRDKSVSLYKVDIWCLGIILFAMVCGRYPFYHPDPQRLLRQVAAADLGPLPGHFSPELIDLLHLLLHVDPKRRPDIAALLQHPWLKSTVGREISTESARTVPSGSD